MKADGSGCPPPDEQSRARRRAVLLVGRQADRVSRAAAVSRAELTDYMALLKDHLWRPTKLELYVMDRDGKNNRR